jgi:short-subunit dehydrogenase
MSQALAAEVARFGIHVTLVEPGGYATDWRDSSAVRADPITAYEFLRQGPSSPAGENRGDPTETADAILRLVDSSAPPLRLLLGRGPLEIIQSDYAQRLATWEAWSTVSTAAGSAGAALPPIVPDALTSAAGDAS